MQYWWNTVGEKKPFQFRTRLDYARKIIFSLFISTIFPHLYLSRKKQKTKLETIR